MRRLSKFILTSLKTGEVIEARGLKELEEKTGYVASSLYDKSRFKLERIKDFEVKYKTPKRKNDSTGAKRGTYNNWKIVQYPFSKDVIVCEKSIRVSKNLTDVNYSEIKSNIEKLVNFYSPYNFKVIEGTEFDTKTVKSHIFRMQFGFGYKKDFQIKSKIEKSKKLLDLIDKYCSENFNLK